MVNSEAAHIEHVETFVDEVSTQIRATGAGRVGDESRCQEYNYMEPYLSLPRLPRIRAERTDAALTPRYAAP